jgi:transcriptional regulator with XRE-family HTH domain
MTEENKTTAGELLRQGRLRQRLSIAECAKRTHIAIRYIEALEEGRWNDLPSESHRLGFLRLYARFLGISAEEVVSLYHHKGGVPASGSAAAFSSTRAQTPAVDEKEPPSAGWSPSSIPQLIGIAIVALLMAWVVYHLVTPRVFEQNPMPWARRRSPSQARLVVPKSSITFQKVRLKAEADSWLRITSRNQLLFEGILPAGTSKEWSGPGPFQFKIGNVHALALYWNDQPVDIQAGARGPINDIRIPPQ